MPLYGYKCVCGKTFDRVLRVSEYETEQTCECGLVAQRQIFAAKVFVQPEYKPYKCPITDKVINGRKAHNENLAQTGCRVLESGEKEDAARYREYADKKLEDSMAEDVARQVAALPTKLQEQLGNELAQQFLNNSLR